MEQHADLIYYVFVPFRIQFSKVIRPDSTKFTDPIACFPIDQLICQFFDDLHLQIINLNNSLKASLDNSSAQWAMTKLFRINTAFYPSAPLG